MLEVVEVRLMKMSVKEDPLLPITRIGVKEEWGEWSLEQEKRFEVALAKEEREEEEEEDDDDDDEREEGEEGKRRRKWKWYERVAAMVPGKDASQVEKHYRDLIADVKCIEEGRIRLPNYRDLPESGADSPPTVTARFLAKDGTPFRKPPPPGGGFHHDPERRKGIPWTEEEHRLFLEGLDKFGKGDWRSISRNFVVSRTPTQVASHAQKYFIRLNSMNKEKRRTSIHDITTSTATTTNGARELGQEGTPTSLMQLPNSPSHPLFTTPRPTQYALPPPPPPTPTIGHAINTNPNGHAHAPFVSYVPTVTMPMPMPHPATYY